jgi:hypothetical protein
VRGLTDFEREWMLAINDDLSYCDDPDATDLFDEDPILEAAFERLRNRGLVTLAPCPDEDSNHEQHAVKTPLGRTVLELDAAARGLIQV